MTDQPYLSTKTVLACVIIVLLWVTIVTYQRNFYLISKLESQSVDCTQNLSVMSSDNSDRLERMNIQVIELERVKGILQAETNIMLGRLEQMILIFGGLEGKPKFQQLMEWFQGMYSSIQKSHKQVVEAGK